MDEHEHEMSDDKTACDIWEEWAEKVKAHGHSLYDVLWEFLDADSFDYPEYEDKGLETIDGAGVTGDFEEFLAERYSKPFNQYEALVATIGSAVEGQIKFVPVQPEYTELVHKLATLCAQQKKRHAARSG